VIRPANPTAAWAGSVRLPPSGAPVIAAALAPGTPLYEAGLDRGDQIVAVGDRAIAGAADWTAALAAAKPSDEVQIRFLQRGVEQSATLRFAADPSFTLARAEAGGGSVTPTQLAFREAWLGAATE
jgi:predicted metalloprotease with PDZ domain